MARIEFREDNMYAIDEWAFNNSELIQATSTLVSKYLSDTAINSTTEAQAIACDIKDIDQTALDLLIVVLSGDSKSPIPLISAMGQLASKLQNDDSNKSRYNSFINAGELLLIACQNRLAELTITYMGTYMIAPVTSDESLSTRYISQLPSAEPTDIHRSLGKYTWKLTNTEALQKLNDTEMTILPFNEPVPPEGDEYLEEQMKYKIRKSFVSNLVGKKIFFNWHADHRGRMYSGGYYANPQGTEFEKSMIAFANSEKLTPGGESALKVSISSAYGMSKATFIERLAWFNKHEKNIAYHSRYAKEPHTFRKLVKAWKLHKEGKAINVPIEFD